MKGRIIKFIKKVLGFLGFHPTKRISPWRILIAVADAFEIRKDWIVRSSRKRCHVIPRHVFFYLCRTLLPRTALQAITQTANRKSHTTVLYGIKSIKRRMRSDHELSDRINQIRNSLE